MKKVPTTKFLDKLHRGVVIACLGLTAYGTLLIGNRVYRYFTVIKPQRETAELKFIEEAPIDTSAFVDKAPKLST